MTRSLDGLLVGLWSPALGEAITPIALELDAPAGGQRAVTDTTLQLAAVLASHVC